MMINFREDSMCVANVGNVSERAREEMELIERMYMMACVVGFCPLL